MTVSGNKKRNNRRNSFTSIDNSLHQDNRLSYRARGLFGYMWSKPGNWKFTEISLAKETPKEGRDAIRSAIKELITYGYLYRKQNKTNNGKFSSETIYELYECFEDNPYFSTDVGLSNNGADVGLPDVGLSNTNKNKVPSKESKRDILIIYNQVESIFTEYIEHFDEQEKMLLLQNKKVIIRRVSFNIDKSVSNIQSYVTVCIDNELKKITTTEEYKKSNVSTTVEEYNNKVFTAEEKMIAAYDWTAELGEEN